LVSLESLKIKGKREEKKEKGKTWNKGKEGRNKGKKVTTKRLKEKD